MHRLGFFLAAIPLAAGIASVGGAQQPPKPFNTPQELQDYAAHQLAGSRDDKEFQKNLATVCRVVDYRGTSFKSSFGGRAGHWNWSCGNVITGRDYVESGETTIFYPDLNPDGSHKLSYFTRPFATDYNGEFLDIKPGGIFTWIRPGKTNVSGTWRYDHDDDRLALSPRFDGAHWTVSPYYNPGMPDTKVSIDPDVPTADGWPKGDAKRGAEYAAKLAGESAGAAKKTASSNKASPSLLSRVWSHVFGPSGGGLQGKFGCMTQSGSAGYNQWTYSVPTVIDFTVYPNGTYVLHGEKGKYQYNQKDGSIKWVSGEWSGFDGLYRNTPHGKEILLKLKSDKGGFDQPALNARVQDCRGDDWH